MRKIGREEWNAFFDTLERIVNMEGMTADEKGEMVRGEAEAYGQDTNLQEFCAQVMTD